MPMTPPGRQRFFAVAAALLVAIGAMLLAQSQAPPVFRAAANLVEVIVRVTDAQGQFVPNLTIKDFELRERGRPEAVVAFNYVNLPRQTIRTETAGRPVLASPDMSTVSTNAGVAEARLFVLLLDDLHTAPHRTIPARAIARDFVARHVGASDLVAVFSTGGRGVLTQEFTTDKARVLAAIDRFFGARIRCCETEPEAVYHARAATDVIQSLTAHLAALRGRRISLLWLSEGIDYDLTGQNVPRGCILREPGPPDQRTVAQALERSVDALRRANVTMYAVDPRRLAGAEDITVEMNPGCGSLPDEPLKVLARSIDNLRSLSEQTGGFAAVNTNEFREAFEQIVEESSQYYVLGFQPSRPGLDGDFRSIQVRIAGQPRLRVSSRPGYVVSKPGPTSPRPTDVSPELADALVRNVPTAGLPLRVQAIPRRGADNTSRVHVIVEVFGKDLQFAEVNGQYQERLEFALRTIDSLGRSGHNQKTTVELTIPPNRIEDVRKTGVRWLSTLDVPSGRYSLRVAGQAIETRQTGSVFLDIDVPKFEEDKLWIGGLALTSPSAALAVTAGTSAAAFGLPGPPMTARTFVKGDVVTVSAEVSAPTEFTPGTFELTVKPQRPADPQAAPLLQRTVDLPDREAAEQPRAWAVDTTELGAGQFVLRLTVRDKGGRPAETAALFEVVEP